MKKNKKAIVLCTALCIMAFGLQNSVKAAMSEQANELYTQAIKFENEERYEDALDLILKDHIFGCIGIYTAFFIIMQLI